MNRFFITPDRISVDTVQFTNAQSRQIRNVLRLKAGSMVSVFDGSGTEFEVELDSESSGRILRSYNPNTESNVKLTLIQGLPKGERSDQIVQKCTEVGVYRIVFINTERSIPDISTNRIEHKLSRWQAIAVEAAEQCGRVKVPEISGILSFSHGLEIAAGNGIIAWEEEDARVSLLSLIPQISMKERIFLFIGPEGGFAPEEVFRAKESGLLSASLGRRILRTETAAIAASASIIMGIEALHTDEQTEPGG